VASVLLPHDAMPSADYAVTRCLSVCLSRGGIVSKQLNISANFFSLSSSHTILVFLYQTFWQYSNGNLQMWASMQQWYEKNCDSRPISRFILEVIQDRARVTIECEYQTAPKLQMVLFSMTLKRLLTHISRSCSYLALNISEMVQDTDIVTTEY